MKPARAALLAFLAAGLVLILADTACPMDATQTDVAILSLAAGADYASTHYALSRGLHETNPLMGEPALSLALKAASVAATTAACRSLRRGGHRRAAKVARWGVAAIWMGVAARNLQKARAGR